MKFCQFSLLFIAIWSAMSCTSLERSNQSGYSHPANAATKPGSAEKRTVVGGPSSMEAQLLVQKLESALPTKKEVEQYSKILPYFQTDEERVEFLGLSGYDKKQAWLKDKNFSDRPDKVGSTMKELVESQDITVGMPIPLVKKSWGEPDSVEVSGNPAFHNERWKYNRYVSSNDGYKPEKKFVYFEGGRVVGWEVE